MDDATAADLSARKGPALQSGTTAAITAAALSHLAASGFGRLSMDAIAKTAGVGKAALYRRWRSKDAMVVDLLSDIGFGPDTVIDTGSLAGDIAELLHGAAAVLSDPTYSRIMPHLYAEMATSSAVAALLRSSLYPQKQRRADMVLNQAIARGELSDDVDRGLAVDLLYGPMYWRLVVLDNKMPKHDVQVLADVTSAALLALDAVAAARPGSVKARA